VVPALAPQGGAARITQGRLLAFVITACWLATHLTSRGFGAGFGVDQRSTGRIPVGRADHGSMSAIVNLLLNTDFPHWWLDVSGQGGC
jgi:hypothetical protein